MKERDRKRFAYVDIDNDKLLSRQELGFLTHPEESARMTSLLVQVSIIAWEG